MECNWRHAATVAKCVADDDQTARATAASRRDPTDRQTVDYHVDMRHVADVVGSRQAGSVLRRIFLADHLFVQAACGSCP